MMRWMIHSSMRLRLVVLAAAALVMVFGFTTMDSMPLDALPEFSRPYVEVQTEALGLSADEVEAMITTPLEADMLNGTPWVETVRSQSIPGLSSIVLVFKKGTDLMRARQMVQERLTQIFALPSVSKPPVMINPRSSASRVMEIGLTSESLSLIEMSVLARWTIVPRLMGLPGVANVSIWGQRQRQLQVQVDPAKLRDKGITLMQIISTTGNALWSSPLSFLEASTPGTGGWIDTPNQRLGVRHLLPITTAEDLAKVTVDGATSMRLGDVATVVEDHQPLIGDAIVKGEPALMLVVDKFPWANTTEVTEEVEIALADLRPGLTGMEMDSTLFRPATFLELAMNNFATALLIGAALALVVLFVFLSHWRGALIAGISVFASAMAALTVLYLRGAELNLMVFAGLMLALSAVVDDAIVGVDAISRRLREARTNGNGGSRASLIAEAAIDSRGPLFYATVILVLVVLPVFFLEGLSGAFLQPLVLSYLLALLASMLVATTVTPALSVMFSQSKGEAPASKTLGTIYDGLFSWAAKTPRMAFIAVLVMACGFLALPVVRQETLLPELKETDLVVRFQGNPSASHPAMNRITRLAGRELRSIPGVRNVSAHVGRAVMSDQRTNVDAAELWVSIDPAVDYDAAVNAVKEVVAGYPGLSREVLTYLQAKFREELSGTGESLVVRVYGEDMGIIRQKADEVRDVMASIDGIVDPTVQYPREMPTLEIEVDLEKAKPYGLKPGDVRRAATSIVSGVEVGALFEEQKVFEVVVQGVPDTRHSLTSIQNLLVDTPSGGHVRLQEVAEVRIVPAPTVIHRDAVARRMDVTAAVDHRDLAAVAADVRSGLERIEFPLEYRAELLGEYAERLAAQERVRAYAVAAALGIFLVLQAFFRSWRLAGAIFVTLPMALSGGVLTAYVQGGGLLSIGSLIGFVAVFGVVVRNSIMLISRYRYLEREGEAFGAALIQRGTRERFAPMVMTTLATAVAFLPFALFGSVAGLEILSPMAIVVLGGLVTTTLFTLYVVPALYVLLGAAREAELELEAAGEQIAMPGPAPAGSE